MPSAESEHPLRADPLQALPDAVRVPRRPRPRAPSPAPSPAPRRRHPPTPPPPSASFDRHARRLLSTAALDDPLLAAVAARAETPPPPPAGLAFATDLEALSSTLDDELDANSPPLAAGLVDRSDVSLLAPSPPNAVSGVYIVRSRRNWAFAATPGPTPTVLSPTAEPEYYHVRRSIADFTWLEDRLRYRYDAVIVPQLPPMALTGRLRYGYAYDGERLRGLERFLRRVATHAVLSTGDEVLSFLGATGDEAWRKIRREPVSHESSITSALFGGAGDLNAFERIGHWGEKMLWQAGRRFNKGLDWFLERDATSDPNRRDGSAEARLERLQSYVQELGVSLSTVRSAVRRVAQSRELEMRNVVGMQRALQKLGEREGGSFGSQMERVVLEIPPEIVVAAGPGYGSPSSLERESRGTEAGTAESSNSVAGFGDTVPLPTARAIDDLFEDYEERARGAQRIMSARKEEQDAYEHALAVYTKLRDKLEIKTGSMWETDADVNALPTRGEGMEELVNDVNAASARLADVRRRYQAVAVSTTDELRRLRNELHGDLCDALLNLAMEFSRQHAAHSHAWATLATTLIEYREGSARRE